MTLYINDSDVKNIADNLLNSLNDKALTTLDEFIVKNIELSSSPSTIYKGLVDKGIPIPKAASKNQKALNKAISFLTNSLSGIGLGILLTKGLLNELNPEKHPHLFPRITDERLMIAAITSLGLVLISYIIYYRTLSMDLQSKLEELENPTEIDGNRVLPFRRKNLVELPKNVKR